ncbi:mechanosensitive ion channel family protein [Sphingobacterium tabacisoli]|uniref:Mechanosensitive ion channel family protein n=1 Tax=Sphingobacterium tabacisoli TaxID=2044855 RepID=A0ABW5L6Y2_9SPHI|nr:mechanosensitive ion channel domain-containing protein [Sphingobacterium tabacisoli]
MKGWLYSFLLGFLLSASCVWAQTDKEESGKATDSIQKEIISQGENTLQEMRKQQIEDSIRRSYLEKQLLSSRRTDVYEQRKLVEELTFLKSRDSLLMAKRRLKVDSLRAVNKGAPVVPFNDTLFTVFNAIGSYSAKERAKGTSERIQQLENNYEFKTDSLIVQQTEDNWILLWRDQIILSVNEHDALWANKNAGELTESYRQIIAQAIDQYREEHSLTRLLTSTGIAIVVVLSVGLIIFGLSKSVNLLNSRLLKSKRKRFKGITFKGYQLISPAQELKSIWFVTGLLRWLLILTVIYLALPILFNLFPSTKGYAPILIGYFMSPLKKVGLAVIDYFPDLVTVIVVYFIFHYALRVLKYFAEELAKGSLVINGFYSDWALPTYHILRVLLMAFFLVVIFPYLPGAQSDIFKGVSVFIGVLFTFSSAGALGNIVAGLMLTYMRSFVVGDRVKFGDVTGDIVEKSLLVTRIRTPNNEVVSIPNSQIMGNHTINYSAEADQQGLIINTKVAMAYEVPWQTFHELAKVAVARTELLETTPEPFIFQSSLDDYYVTYQINAYTRHPHRQAFIYSELHKHVMDVFHEAGIGMVSPKYHAVRDGAIKDMPEKYRGVPLRSFHVDIKGTKEGE